jgi:hypothetical protein
MPRREEPAPAVQTVDGVVTFWILAVTPSFTKLRVSIQSPKPNMRNKVAHSMMMVLDGEG